MNENLREQKMISKAPFFLWATVGYALFYVFCLYKNGSGITFPLFTLGTIIYFVLCMKKLDVTVKKYSVFYMICIELLGLSTCLTDSWVIILLNKFAIFFLIIIFLLHNFFENKHWNFLDYIKAYFLATIVPIIYVGKPFTNLFDYRRNKSISNAENKKSKIIYVILGIIISIPLVIVVMSLLSTADVIFGNIFRNMFKYMDFIEFIGNVFGSVFLFLFVFFVSYMIISFMGTFKFNENNQTERSGEPLIAITVCAILSFIYVIFCCIQLPYLFMGSAANFVLPSNMTYAEYAREGFFQLLFVCIINLILVLIGIYLFKENKVLKVILCIITGCTYIMIASSAKRMLLYIQYKYLTFLRVFVLWALFVIALVMIGALISIFKEEFNFFKYSTIVVICLYLVLSFARVDYFVAKVNIDNMEEETQYEFFEDTELYDDYYYLIYNLSYDAAPVILAYEDGSDAEDYGSINYEKKEYVQNIKYDTNEMSLRKTNISRLIAKSLVQK